MVRDVAHEHTHQQGMLPVLLGLGSLVIFCGLAHNSASRPIAGHLALKTQSASGYKLITYFVVKIPYFRLVVYNSRVSKIDPTHMPTPYIIIDVEIWCLASRPTKYLDGSSFVKFYLDVAVG